MILSSSMGNPHLCYVRNFVQEEGWYWYVTSGVSDDETRHKLEAPDVHRLASGAHGEIKPPEAS